MKLETVTDEVHPHVKLAGKDAKSQRIKELKLLLLLKLIDKYNVRLLISRDFLLILWF